MKGGGNRSRVLCIHVPHEILFRHGLPTMLTHEHSFLKGRSESQQQSNSGETVPDLCKISDGPTQRRGLAFHEGIESHPFRKEFDEIVDLREGMVEWVVAS